MPVAALAVAVKVAVDIKVVVAALAAVVADTVVVAGVEEVRAPNREQNVFPFLFPASCSPPLRVSINP